MPVPVVLVLEAPAPPVAAVVAAAPSADVEALDEAAACVRACSKLVNKLFALLVLLVLLDESALESASIRWPPWWCEPLPAGTAAATSEAKVAL